MKNQLGKNNEVAKKSAISTILAKVTKTKPYKIITSKATGRVAALVSISLAIAGVSRHHRLLVLWSLD